MPARGARHDDLPTSTAAVAAEAPASAAHRSWLAIVLWGLGILAGTSGVVVTWQHSGSAQAAPVMPPAPAPTAMVTTVQPPRVELLSRAEAEQIATTTAQTVATKTAEATTTRYNEIRQQDQLLLEQRFKALDGKVDSLLAQNRDMIELVRVLARKR